MKITLSEKDIKIINWVFWKLNLHIHIKDRIKNTIEIDSTIYDDVLDVAKKSGITRKKQFYRILYICLQFQKSMHTTKLDSIELKELYKSKITEAKDYISLHDLKEKYLAKEKGEDIKFINFDIVIKINGKISKIEFSNPEVLLKRLNIPNLEIPAERDNYEEIINFMSEYFFVPNTTYYRKNAAHALKIYCDKFKILISEKKVKNPSKQMRFIYYLLNKFSIIEDDFFEPGNEVKSIISLLNTPYKVIGPI